MKKIIKFATITFLAAFVICASSLMVSAEETAQMKTGVYIEDIDVSGMTAEEVQSAVEDYLVKMQAMTVVLRAAQGNEVEVTAGDFGMEWSNTEIVEEALSLGNTGNPIAKYKEIKDLEIRSTAELNEKNLKLAL